MCFALDLQAPFECSPIIDPAVANPRRVTYKQRSKSGEPALAILGFAHGAWHDVSRRTDAIPQQKRTGLTDSAALAEKLVEAGRD